MPLVNVEGIGLIDFPEGMSGEDIGNAIKKDILPQYPELAAKSNRSFGEAITDVGAGLATGIGGLAQVPGQLTQLAGLTSAEDSGSGLQGLGKQLEEFGQESKSVALRGKEAVRAKKISEADGILAEFGTAIKETIKDPALIMSFFAEQLPNLAGSWGGGLLARGATKALMSDTIKTSLGASGVGEKLGKAGLAGAVGTGAVMQGADIGSETYELAFKEAKKLGMDDEEANALALSKGRVAAIEAFGLSLGTARLPGGASIERALAGKGLPGAGGFAKGFAGEALSEGIEEGGGKFASNVGVQEVNPEVSLTKGVGAAAGMGALGGALFGGIAGYANAGRENESLAIQEQQDAQRQEALNAVEAVKQAEDQARRDAFEAEQTAIRLRALQENAPERFKESEAYAELEAKVAKARAATVKADEAKTAYKESAFHEAFPDLLGDITPQQEQVDEQPIEPKSIAQAGQQELPFIDEQGQMNLPGMPTPEVPAQVAEIPDTRPVTESDFKAMNIGKTNKKLREQLLGKDLNDPDQVAEVRDVLENWVQQGRGESVNQGVGAFLDAIPKPLEAQEQQRLGLRRPYGSLKPKQDVLSAEDQNVIQQELEDEQRAFQDEATGETTTPIGDSSESSVRVPSDGLGTTTRSQQPERRGMDAAGDITGQPIGREAPVESALEEPAKPLLLEPAVTLSTRHAKEYKEAAANYLEKANYIGQRALENVAGDLYTGENLKDAKRFHRGLSEGQKGFVQKKLDELNKYERRGTAYNDARTAKQNAKAAFEEELDQDENPKVSSAQSEVTGRASEKLTQAAQRGDLAGALNAISKDTSDTFNILEKLVSNRLLANKGSLPKIQIVPAGTIKDGSAQYNPFTDTVQINEGEVDSHTVLHEAVHGFLHTLIQKFETEGAKNKGIADLDQLYKFIQNRHPELADRYGMESLTEFASELMSNREFQADLAQIPYRTEAQSLFSAFVRAVLNALGLSPTQKLSALAAGLFAADRSLAQGRAVQEMRTGVETGPVVKVSRAADLAANYKATGAGRRAKPTEETGPFQTVKDTLKSKATAKQGLSRFLNAAETMLFSSDAALNNAIRRGLEAGGKSWGTIKKMMYEISTAQASHAGAIAMQFLEKGNVVYDEKISKWVAKEDKNSWAGLVNQISNIAKQYGVEFETMNNYAQEAFVAERLKGLSKADRSVYSHKTPEQIEAGLKYFQMIPELRKVQESWNKVRENAMRVAVEGGLYNEAQAKELLDYMDYVPFYREDQLTQGAGPKEYGRGLIDFAKGFKLKGSDQEVANIFDNMERWTSYTISRAVKNRTALNLYTTAKELFPDEVTDLRQDETVHREQNTIDLWVDGNRRKVEFKDPLFIHAFNGIEAVAVPQFRAGAAVSNFLRKNIVLMPLFSISQLSQDSFGAMLTSGLKNPWALPLEVMKEFVKTLRGTSKAATELTAVGAAGERDYSDTMMRDTAEIMAGLKQDKKSGKFRRALETFAMASDNAVRQAIYNMTMKETGGDKALAVERAFEIINFKRSGASGKVQMLRQVVPFFGAYLQAQNVLYKTIAGKGIAPQQKKEAQRILISNALKISALSFMYAALVSDDDDYQKMDPQTRDRHLLIPGTSIMLPMRSDLTLMPKLLAEYAYLSMTDNGFTDGKKTRRALGDALTNAVLSPTAVPQAAKPIFEVFINRSFYTGRPIIGQGIANKLTEEQYTKSTSEISKFIGSSGVIAPVNVDHLIKGYLGTTGGLGLMVTNWLANGASDQPKPEKSWQDAIASTPGLSAFVAREYGNADKNDFYELREEVSKVNNTINAMTKQGRTEEAKELFADKQDLMKVKTQVSNINNQLTKLREYENHIYDLPESKMDAEKKGEAIKRIREQEKKLLSNVNALRKMAGY